MSKKTELEADLKRIGLQLAGAHLTRQARTATFKTFARTMNQLKYGIQRADQIGGRHLIAFVAERKALGASNRTIANELSHIRAVLRQIGKEGLANNPNYSNKALGIERGSRTGTKQPLADPTIRTFQDKMDRHGRSGIGAILGMQRELGLREAEAIRAGQAETLARWERELKDKGFVRVVEGTKGGRPRDVHPANVDRALAAIRSAQAVLQATGQRYLVVRADGSPAAGLKQAMNIYRNVCHREGIQSHGARYAFARERLEAYKAQGLSEREALAATSLDLGHGDGRGRYIASVYAR
ncbi:MAG: integrase domain-containing protein [Nevskia sp.]|nr:integrase domain-containing protein [Nevskia sp.]